MSTLPVLASKGEKEKSKYQSLDINKLYRVSLGESSENKQQKSTLSQKHGMQSLGKVPNTRRPPANLPSLKSEHSGADTAVSLVPSNGSGWGKQETIAQTSTTTTIASNNANAASTPITQITAHQAAIALPVTTTIHLPSASLPSGNKASAPGGMAAAAASSLDKSWSSVMLGSAEAGIGIAAGGAGGAHPPPYQSPQFQHEFPSLSAGDGVLPPRASTDAQYAAPGLSLRPQTEGSWQQGGAGANPAAQVTAAGIQGQAQRAFLPQFMFRGSGSGGGSPMIGGQQARDLGPGCLLPSRPRPEPQPVAPQPRQEHVAHRPIIKEEDLSGMDNLTGDMGWAINDDIDYNQKLAFSDDDLKKPLLTPTTTVRDNQQEQPQQQERDKPWGNNHSSTFSNPNAVSHLSNVPKSGPSRRAHDEDEFSQQRRRQQAEINSAVERAKQRKEEEEKKYNESRAAAAKKLKELDDKILGKNARRDKDDDSAGGTIHPAAVPPQTIAPVPILLPEWEKEKDVPRNSSANTDDKHKSRDTDFKHLTQIEGRATFSKKDQLNKDHNQQGQGQQSQQHSNFSKQFQHNLPPRFQKQQQLNAQSSFQYDGRWSQSHPGGNRTSPSSRKSREDDKDLDDIRDTRDSRDSRESRDSRDARYRRQDDASAGYTRSHRYSDSSRKSSDSRYDDGFDVQLGSGISRQSSDEGKRPQRPDSRDSRTSRHSEPRDYNSWAEDPIEEKRKDHMHHGQSAQALYKEHNTHRMVVPGPITKEKIEADDLRSGEHRNLTQLKRGAGGMGAPVSVDDDAKKDAIDEPKAWADAPTGITSNASSSGGSAGLAGQDKEKDDDKEDMLGGKERDEKKPRGSTWSGGNVTVYRNSYSSGVGSGGGGGNSGRDAKKNAVGSGSSRGNVRGRGGRDAAESESGDDTIENGPKVMPTGKKSEKAQQSTEKVKIERMDRGDRDRMDRMERDKNHFVPRGEPSRHGRGGGGSSFRGSRGGGSAGAGGGSKRVDTYGPPAKSPFGNTDEDTRDPKKDLDDDDHKKIGGKEKSDDLKKADKRRDTRNRSGGNKPKQDGDVSDNSDVDGRKSKNSQRGPARERDSRDARGRGQVDKRGFGGPRPTLDRPRAGAPMKDPKEAKDIKDKDNTLSAAIVDITLKEVDADEEIIEDGFQEVKGKKAGKVDKKPDDVPSMKIDRKVEKKPDPRGKTQVSSGSITSGQISPQQPAASIPSLMATPINPPASMQTSKPGPGMERQDRMDRDRDRNRQNKLPPRFAKAKEHNRIQKMQQGGPGAAPGIVNNLDDMTKVPMYALKDGMMNNAWDKPLAAQIRLEQDHLVGNIDPLDQSALHHASVPDDKAVLDGSKPLNTIIFENTNYKSAPGCPRSSVNSGPTSGPVANNGNRDKRDIDGLGFNKPNISELLSKVDKVDSIQMQLFNKEDSADMKLDFLESDISSLSSIVDEKGAKMPTSGMGRSSGNILTADALNMKIQSVKKVWENIPNVMQCEHPEPDFASFAPEGNVEDAEGHGHSAHGSHTHGHEYPSASVSGSNSTTNVCKVKPTQQVAGGVGQVGHQPHSMVMGHTLSSPPPIQPVMGGYTPSQHINYQAAAGIGNSHGQYGGIPAPSPPTVLNYSQQTGLYAPFLDTGHQGRSQFSQYSFGLGQTGSSPYSQSMYHAPPPPNVPNPAQDMYSSMNSMNSFRMPTTGPFGQNQQLSNPTTVLISSTSNSLMSPSVKPSVQQHGQHAQQQQISAIGTKAGGVGQAYQQSQQQGQQVYIPFDYMQNANVIQRGPPGGPVQNNVVAGVGLQQSSSFYSGSNAQSGYFQGSSTMQGHQHQTGFSLQQSVFPTHNQSHTQNYPTYPTQMQLAAAAAMSYRTPAGIQQQQQQYMKSQLSDQQARQQLKSPGSQQQQEVLSSVFNSGPQIASPKSRQLKQQQQPPPQPSPTAHNKYMYGGGMSQQGQGQGQTRYPAPIQRPPAGNYNMNSGPGQGQGPGQKAHHRMNQSNARSGNSGCGGSRYYGSQGNMNTHPQADKADDAASKLEQAGSGAKQQQQQVPSDAKDAKDDSCVKD